jgi:4-alpha-glucanotransferase
VGESSYGGRGSGILLHPTSLPGPFGIGGLGTEAYQFLDYLEQSGQTLWQLLPLGPTGYGDSPYQSFSSFAGNPLLIDPRGLSQQGFLPAEALEEPPPFPGHRVEYGELIPYKLGLLHRAYEHWKGGAASAGPEGAREEFEGFCARQKHWLEDFALFMALKRRHLEEAGGVWNRWPPPLRRREPRALEESRRELAAEIDEVRFQQYLFARQWGALRRRAAALGIRIIGDLPIFVAYDSADVWAHQELFQLDGAGEPTVVAGVPPDYFSETGQLWGNPLYRWKAMRENGYAWWIERVKSKLGRVDLLRLDHFRGFEAYWEVPAGEETAVKGRWVKGPGAGFFEALRRALGQLPIIAEDLGLITPEVERLRDRFLLPGMKVLQFAFDGKPENPFLPHNYTNPNCVVYTGTHDNDTTRGWYSSLGDEWKDQIRRYLARDGQDIAWDLTRLAYSSVARMAVVPLQDLLGLGSEGRMNFPSRPAGNWQWRVSAAALSPEISGRLREMTALYGRLPAAGER